MKKMLDEGDFFNILKFIMFGIVEKDVPPDIGRLLGGVSLLFTHLGLHGPPTIYSFFYLWLIEVGKIKVQIEKKLNKRKVKEKKYNKMKVKGLV